MDEDIPREEKRKKLKIRRMALKSSTIVEVVRVDSPSSFFVRPANNIRNNLVFSEPFQLSEMTDIQVGDFGLAPIEERLMGRCLVLKTFPTYSKVFFIDDAITANINNKCIFHINESECYYPWQVIHVTMNRLETLDLSGEWTSDQTDSFIEVLSKFGVLQINACEFDESTDPYRPAINVELFGFLEEDFRKPVDVTDLYAVKRMDIIVVVDHAIKKKIDIFASFIDESTNIEDFRQKLPDDWIHDIKKTTNIESDDWKIVANAVKEWEMEDIQKLLHKKYRKQKEIEEKLKHARNLAEIEEGKKRLETRKLLTAFVDDEAEITPYSLFVRPIEKPDDWMDDDYWLVKNYAEMKEMSESLNMFYSMLKNQKPLSVDEIENELENGKLYGMCASFQRKSTVSTWKRCEIISVDRTTDTVTVKFLDFGGKCMQKAKNLHRIHELHTRKLPFSLEIQNMVEEIGNNGVEYEMKQFLKKCMPFDLPITAKNLTKIDGKWQCRKIEIPGYEGNLIETLKNQVRRRMREIDGLSSDEDEWFDAAFEQEVIDSGVVDTI